MTISFESARAAIARARALPWARPLLRGALAGLVLVVLVVVGRATFAGARPAATAAIEPEPSLPSAAPTAAQPAPDPPPATAAAPVASAIAADTEPSPPPAAPASHGPATPDDPVVLNDATAEDLQRLPGVGMKRALAILDLRQRLGGRFHQIEDLLKVRGIGLKTLRRLRPLVRLDRPPPPPAPDGGSG
jgi:competence protein ComEA